ncbi:MAG: dehydratase, partial [Actinobacteria bacterium]|nr:dehydratase [Actinomycetota bacterium]
EFSARFTKPVVVPADVKVRISFTGKVSGVSHNEVSIDVNALCDGVKVLGQTKVRVQL